MFMTVYCKLVQLYRLKYLYGRAGRLPNLNPHLVPGWLELVENEVPAVGTEDLVENLDADAVILK